jgi:hypothetical protein
MNDVNPTDAPKVRKPESKIRKPKTNDIELSNPYENQTTQFASCIENPNANNSCCNHKNARNTSDAGCMACC